MVHSLLSLAVTVALATVRSVRGRVRYARGRSISLALPPCLPTRLPSQQQTCHPLALEVACHAPHTTARIMCKEEECMLGDKSKSELIYVLMNLGHAPCYLSEESNVATDSCE